MMRQNLRLTVVALMSAGIIVLSSCTSDKPTAAPPRYQSSVSTQPGVAGGVYEEMVVVQAIVTAIDLPSRRITLTGSEGGQLSFTAEPEIKNLPQVRTGDRVTATFLRRMIITVRTNDATPSDTHAITQATAEKGAKPGVLVAEQTDKVARVMAIDTVNRTADLQFSDGMLRNVPLRADVDLSRYKAGDNVLIRVTTALKVIVEAP